MKQVQHAASPFKVLPVVALGVLLLAAASAQDSAKPVATGGGPGPAPGKVVNPRLVELIAKHKESDEGKLGAELAAALNEAYYVLPMRLLEAETGPRTEDGTMTVKGGSKIAFAYVNIPKRGAHLSVFTSASRVGSAGTRIVYSAAEVWKHVLDNEHAGVFVNPGPDGLVLPRASVEQLAAGSED